MNSRIRNGFVNLFSQLLSGLGLPGPSTLLIVFIASCLSFTSCFGKDFNVIGLDPNMVMGRELDITIEIFSESGGLFHFLDNPNGTFRQHEYNTVYVQQRGYGKIYTILHPYAVLKPGLNKIVLPPDPNNPVWREVVDFANTGRAMGIGIKGRFMWMEITINGVKYRLVFDKADVNRDGVVDVADYAIYSRQWQKKMKIERK